MKTTNIILSLALMGSITMGFADANPPLAIDAQIEAIQSASPQERVQLMNEFKLKLSNMNAQERSSAISQMQAKMSTQHRKNTSHSQEARGHEGMQEQMQMNANDGTSRMQNMNQNQAGNHYGQEQQHSGGMINSPMNDGPYNKNKDFMSRQH